jgi:hypothetical protein
MDKYWDNLYNVCWAEEPGKWAHTEQPKYNYY